MRLTEVLGEGAARIGPVLDRIPSRNKRTIDVRMSKARRHVETSPNSDPDRRNTSVWAKAEADRAYCSSARQLVSSTSTYGLPTAIAKGYEHERARAQEAGDGNKGGRERHGAATPQHWEQAGGNAEQASRSHAPTTVSALARLSATLKRFSFLHSKHKTSEHRRKQPDSEGGG